MSNEIDTSNDFFVGYPEVLREKQELLEDAEADRRQAELNLLDFIHDHKPRRKQ